MQRKGGKPIGADKMSEKPNKNPLALGDAGYWTHGHGKVP